MRVFINYEQTVKFKFFNVYLDFDGKNKSYEKVGVLIIKTESEDGAVEEKEYQLEKKDIKAIVNLIIDREKKVMLANPTNVEKAQDKDPVLSRMNRLLWWEW